MTHSRRLRREFLAACLGGLALAASCGCAVGPRYRRPAIVPPPAFKEADGWVPAQPADHQPRGPWWAAFGDTVLDRLESQVEVSSTTLAIAEAQYRQALALAGIAYADLFPSIQADATATRTKSAARPGIPELPAVNTFSAGLSAAWELDLWGRLRRANEASRAAAQASAADLESARLSLHALLAQTYFSLRTVETDRRLIERLTQGYEESLRITQNQYEVGVAARSDVDAAIAQLKQAQAQGVDLGAQRAQLEHALAALLGRFPAEFSLAPSESAAALPTPPPLLPAELLQRRPDVAAAERRLAAASAEIGVAVAGYFPTLSLSASAGYQSLGKARLLSASNQVWALGASAAQTVFDAGKTRAGVAGARASYDQSLAAYRQTVLAAFQDAEDNLAAVRILAEEASVQDQAVAAARSARESTLNQYRAGTVSHLNVIVAQATLLDAERTAVDLAGRRVQAVVALYKAIGGDWPTAGGKPARGQE